MAKWQFSQKLLVMFSVFNKPPASRTFSKEHPHFSKYFGLSNNLYEDLSGM